MATFSYIDKIDLYYDDASCQGEIFPMLNEITYEQNPQNNKTVRLCIDLQNPFPSGSVDLIFS